MQVRFWFDPICPWCWLTSRWLAEEVAPARDLEVDWRSISLEIRNDSPDLDPKRRERYHVTHRLLRVCEALRAAGEADRIGALYTELGRRIHHEKEYSPDLPASLAAVGIDASFASAADDDSWDDAVRAATDDCEEVAGDHLGPPVIALEVDGDWKGYFGPVLPQVPRGDDAVAIWDAVVALMRAPGFYELKRHRTERPVMPV